MANVNTVAAAAMRRHVHDPNSLGYVRTTYTPVGGAAARRRGRGPDRLAPPRLHRSEQQRRGEPQQQHEADHEGEKVVEPSALQVPSCRYADEKEQQQNERDPCALFSE